MQNFSSFHLEVLIRSLNAHRTILYPFNKSTIYNSVAMGSFAKWILKVPGFRPIDQQFLL